jgi:hypothetical protein
MYFFLSWQSALSMVQILSYNFFFHLIIFVSLTLLGLLRLSCNNNSLQLLCFKFEQNETYDLQIQFSNVTET